METHVPSYTLANTKNSADDTNTRRDGAFASDAEAMDAYRALYQHSGPLLRLLQSLLMLLSRAAGEHRGSGPKHYPLQPCTFLLLYPVIRGVLLLPHVMPGTEHTFHLLDRYAPDPVVCCIVSRICLVGSLVFPWLSSTPSTFPCNGITSVTVFIHLD